MNDREQSQRGYRPSRAVEQRPVRYRVMTLDVSGLEATRFRQRREARIQAWETHVAAELRRLGIKQE